MNDESMFKLIEDGQIGEMRWWIVGEDETPIAGFVHEMHAEKFFSLLQKSE